uniref:Uncharacterized protein n=1 Tax=Solanum lycopersicum TaxID=4081 RepID=A0A3Q7J653_SOLLC
MVKSLLKSCLIQNRASSLSRYLLHQPISSTLVSRICCELSRLGMGLCVRSGEWGCFRWDYWAE